MGLRNSSGRWQFRFRLHGQNVSVVTDLEATERNRKKALEQEAIHKHRLLQGELGFTRLTPREFAKSVPDFIEWSKIEYPAENTWKRYQTSLTSLTEYFDKKIIFMISTGDIEAYKLWRRGKHKIKAVTLRHDLDALSVFFQWAEKFNYARSNPVEKVSRPSDKDAIRQRILTVEEETAYFQAALARNLNLHDAGRITLLQGTRPEEVLRIRKEDVDITARLLHIRKGKTRAAKRDLRITDEVLSILARRMPGPSPWIFPSDRIPGRHITKLNKIHDAVCDDIKLPFVIYDLRHSFATRMAEINPDPYALAAILGHSDIRTMYRYIHLTQERQNAAMQIMDEKNRASQVPAVAQ